MRNLLLYFITVFTWTISWAQITGNGHNSVSQTVYTNDRPNDNIYVFCGTQLGQANGSLTATSPSGTGPFTFSWSYYNEATNSWVTLTTETGETSTLTNLASDGYQVMIRDENNALMGCYVAWVWNLNVQVSPTNNPLTCNSTNLQSGAGVESSFTYYNIPPGQSLITPQTQITVCFSANHTYVSDLAFYLRAPNGAVIALAPNPGVIGQGATCNSGNNVSNLCFSNTSTNNLNVCTASVPLSGTYGTYGLNATPINWSSLIGQNAAQGGWAVQIYDCIGADVGSLTNASVSFNGLDVTNSCSAEENITYNSGQIWSAINDNSCSAQTASIFLVPLPLTLTTPIVINATVSGSWTASQTIPGWNGTTSTMGNGNVVEIPSGITTFTYNLQATFQGSTCSNVGTTEFENTCCTADADIALSSVTICPNTPTTLTSTGTGTSFVWRPSTGLNDSTALSPVLTLDNTTSQLISQYYYLVAIDEPNDCEYVDSIFVEVHGRPFFQTDSIFCGEFLPMDTIQMTNAGQWSFSGPGVQSTLPSLAPTWQLHHPGLYTISYTDGCQNTVSQVVRKPEVPSIDGDTLICATSLIFPHLDLEGAEGTWSVDNSGTLAQVNDEMIFTGSNEGTNTYVITFVEDKCQFETSRRVVIVEKPTAESPLISCMPNEFDIVSTSYAGGTWSLFSTTPANLNLDSFEFLYPITGDLMAIQVGHHGKYTLMFTDSICGHTVKTELDFKPYVWTEVADTVICKDATHQLVAWKPDFPVDFLWSTGAISNEITINKEGVYYVTISNECFQFTDSAVVGLKICDIEAPNVISLGSQVGNEKWYVQYVGISEFECFIVDRWGNTIYSFDQVTGYWNGKNSDGKEVNEGVYFYKIVALTEGKHDILKQGFITVVK